MKGFGSKAAGPAAFGPWSEIPRGHTALHAQIRAEFGRVVEEFHSTNFNPSWVENGLLIRQVFLDHLVQERRNFR